MISIMTRRSTWHADSDLTSYPEPRIVVTLGKCGVPLYCIRSMEDFALVAEEGSWPPALSGRMLGDPSVLLRVEVPNPQFRYESEHLLPHYLVIEKLLAKEYERMGALTSAEAGAIFDVLGSIDEHTIVAWRDANLSDIAFALERCVEQRLVDMAVSVPGWHVDRRRNDMQSCAQLMFGLVQLRSTAETLLEVGRTTHRLADTAVNLLMSGYTHYQAAQGITPSYYLASVSDRVLHTTRRLLSTYNGIDACPLGSGALAGQQLCWDRNRMARFLGFSRPQTLDLMSAASRGWVLEITAELSIFGVVMSRFCTDLLTWSSSEYGFIDLPDELSAISSAMPQKKNFPVPERIRAEQAYEYGRLHVEWSRCAEAVNEPASRTVSGEVPAKPARGAMGDNEIGTGQAFGTFGELVQGTLPERNRDFLVTFPMDAWTIATFRYMPDSPEIRVSPASKYKVRWLARLALDELRLPGGGILNLVSELPEGKGLASSSVDLVVTARAVSAAFSLSFDEPAIESLLRRIEPSATTREAKSTR